MSLSVGEIFDEYVDSLTNLPSEIDQNMQELRSMDEDFQRHRDAYAKEKRTYLKMLRTSVNNLTLTTSVNGPGMSPTTPSPTSTTAPSNSTPTTPSPELRSQLEKDYKTAIQKQDQKIELAMRMYDLVSRHIERIDSQMAQNNISITLPGDTSQQHQQHRSNYNGAHRSLASSGSTHHHGTRALSTSSMSIPMLENSLSHHHSRSPSNANTTSRKTPHWDDWRGDGNRKRSLLLGATGPRKRTHHSTRQNPAMNTGALMEQDIDPNEPRYCYCNQVSFGDMVACDGENCEKEWFHYACVGLSEPPAGKWFCDDCSVEEQHQRKVIRYI
ncbi:hypothetical protein BCR42DRAFT_403057 [Absidia repens]|uniref:Chromatin modification-related protein n=1 Tax=Absidia repens TaxID=90262 RepID=A0A1X2J0I0_9FUNG|nr:hypothetical protein BCR42DRAFT_403057 [Absidia repens]